MWVATALHQRLAPVPATLIGSPKSNPLAFSFSKTKLYALEFPNRLRKLKVSAAKKQLPETQTDTRDEGKPSIPEKGKGENSDLGWLNALPHVLVASMSNFVFGYHIGVMNGPIVSIAQELGFEGNSILEGLVVSIFIAGAFIGSISTGSLVDKLGCRRTFQIAAIPLVVGAILSARAHSLDEILGGRFLVGLGIGVNTVLVPIYISEVAPTKYRGALGSLCQIGTCLGIISSLFLGIPSEVDPHCGRGVEDGAEGSKGISCEGRGEMELLAKKKTVATEEYLDLLLEDDTMEELLGLAKNSQITGKGTPRLRKRKKSRYWKRKRKKKAESPCAGESTPKEKE
ncbi:putative plastidic glucose transporter 1 [Senna tora]|uniref:Putative plastidic glucose transporter 1 n=1 Tax=Senna tora TaxID=362788 RepID=A0A834WTV4_9FABA|nr:putative plastidic glucose transporter 1 [Senna tora]